MCTALAHAKINLFLNVLAREADGYHQIETLFCKLDLADELIVEPGTSGIALHVEGAQLGATTDNLVHRAALAFCERARIAPSFRITLRKRIPAGAGLGGGSSDAAATLHSLNALAGNPLAADALMQLGHSLGSDVPFFVSGSPLALGWSRGERLLALPPLPRRPVLVVAPATASVTADAYRQLAERRARDGYTAPARAMLTSEFGDWERVSQRAHNDFELIVMEQLPALRHVLAALREHGAFMARMSGSGSAVFGIFDEAQACTAAARALHATLPQCTMIETHTFDPAYGVDPRPGRG
jgi:4-diphosphocytidyl-2-C-methyl-D-erythritol kinase